MPLAESILRDFLDVDVLAALAGLPLHARSPMLGNMSGRHRSPIRGSSLEFSAYRKYVPGDDIRRLDWRAWGRSDRFYIKEFEADTNLRLCLVIDNSGSMGHEADGESKLAYARRVAGTLAYVAAHQRRVPVCPYLRCAQVPVLPGRLSAVHGVPAVPRNSLEIGILIAENGFVTSVERLDAGNPPPAEIVVPTGGALRSFILVLGVGAPGDAVRRVARHQEVIGHRVEDVADLPIIGRAEKYGFLR